MIKDKINQAAWMHTMVYTLPISLSCQPIMVSKKQNSRMLSRWLAKYAKFSGDVDIKSFSKSAVDSVVSESCQPGEDVGDHAHGPLGLHPLEPARWEKVVRVVRDVAVPQVGGPAHPFFKDGDAQRVPDELVEGSG